MDLSQFISVMDDADALHGFVHTETEQEETKASVWFEHQQSREEIEIEVHRSAKYFRVKLLVGEGLDRPTVFQANRQSFLAGLSFDEELNLWSEAVLLVGEVEPTEVVDAARSVIAVWLDVRETVA